MIVVEKQNALLLEMASPLGDNDYSYIVMMMVKGKTILIAEAAGVVEEFQKRKVSILDALQKTALK